MSANVAARFDEAELQRRLQGADGSVLLVPPRILRRVIKQHGKLTAIGLQVPHRKSYVIDRAALLEIADRVELGVEADRELPETVILLSSPSPERIASLGTSEVMLRYWRLLFHARVHRVLEPRVSADRLSPARLRERINRIGRTEFEEIRAVLRQEDLLLPPRDDRTVYVEFAALYLELRHFAPTLLPRYFPGLEDFEQVDALLAEDVDAESLFAATRLAGAPDPVPPPEGQEDVDEAPPAAPALPPSEHDYHRLLERAGKEAGRGNDVRAALLRARAARVAPPGLGPEVAASARADLDRLAERLRAALDLDAAAANWRQVLPTLLDQAVAGRWPPEARLLYDLQKVCVDHERQTYALDLVEWALSFGQRPIKRPLPGQEDILSLKHLRGAVRRLSSTQLPAAARRQLAELIQFAVHHSEERVRERFRPQVLAALDEVGLQPENLPEQVARAKLVEELLDRVCDRGFLTMGDLRDALSRNQLKLPDLAGPTEFLRGDRLLRANGRLAVALDGVYHRGEVYLRWLQRLSSVAFGTPAGRFLTLFFVLPFGGAFLILEGLQHVVARVLGQHHAASAAGEAAEHAHAGVHLLNAYSLVLVGLFLLALIHVPPFRRALGSGLRAFFHGLRAVFVTWPASVLALPAVRRILDSRPWLFVRQYALKPLLVAAPVALVLRGHGAGTALAAAALAFLTTAVLLNTRAGRNLEEVLADWLARRWYRLSNDLIPALFRLIMAFFKRLVEEVERLLYAVDEQLRFRTGDSRLALAVKPVLGLVWFAVTYVVRFCINLLVEPQINPIKHFPVVTVSHKVVFALVVPQLVALFIDQLGMEKARAATLAGTIGFVIPGIFGFMVWEFKENWRLYRANRPRTLRPVMVGHHGETVLRLLRPGFHSGTIPKAYAKMRRAQRRAQRTGRWRSFRKQRDVLRQAEESIRHFVEREFIALLEGSRAWSGRGLAIGAINLGSNRIRVELGCPGLGPNAWLTLEERAGWLVAGVARAGWLTHLVKRGDPPARAFATALNGLYQMSGVDLLRTQIEASFAPACPPYDLTEEGLVVWPGADSECEVQYPLRDGLLIRPRVSDCLPTIELPVLERKRLLLREQPTAWTQWVEVWERDRAGKGLPADLAEQVAP
jgi:hypothetical protein